MHDMVKRHQVQVLRAAGHTLTETAALAGVSVPTVRRVEQEPAVTGFDAPAAVRERRGIGRPSKVEPFRNLIVELCDEKDNDGNPLQAKEIVRRLRAKGYGGGHSAACALTASLRPKHVRPLTRFEGLPGEFCQHDFGHTDVVFTSGARKRVHFFASRLKWSRCSDVTLVENERVESIVRTQLARLLDVARAQPRHSYVAQHRRQQVDDDARVRARRRESELRPRDVGEPEVEETRDRRGTRETEEVGREGRGEVGHPTDVARRECLGLPVQAVRKTLRSPVTCRSSTARPVASGARSSRRLRRRARSAAGTR